MRNPVPAFLKKRNLLVFLLIHCPQYLLELLRGMRIDERPPTLTYPLTEKTFLTRVYAQVLQCGLDGLSIVSNQAQSATS